MTTKRYRKRYDFRLNILKEDEYQIAEQIAALKNQGRYSKTIRDGIRLVCDLQEGNLGVLFELFPWVRAEFLEYVSSVQPSQNNAEAAISERLQRIETMLANGSNGAPSSNGGGGPKAMAVPSLPAPVIDDDSVALTIKKTKTDGEQSAQNFLASAFALQG